MNKKVVIITGASSGIGYACAVEFAKRKANLGLGARSYDSLLGLKNMLENSYGIEVVAEKTDVEHEEDCRNLVQKTHEKFGKIDILINNAGVSMRSLFEELDLLVMKKVMNVNFYGTVFCAKYALPHIMKEKGSIVAISSISGYVGLPGRTAYTASKYAIHGFLESLRMENQKTGLHVMIVAPGFTSTNIRKNALTKNGLPQGETPRDEKEMMSAEEVAKKVAEAITKRKRTLVLTTKGKLVCFFYKFFPKIMDKMIYKYMAKEPNSPFK
ncbi:MAG: short chain dehydrogenase [Bacteroidia bacterium]|nr:MAG: short chain dehydrogenase [Bacteroidia bacterium]